MADLDVKWNDPDGGWGDDLEYQSQGPFYSEQELEAHRQQMLVTNSNSETKML